MDEEEVKEEKEFGDEITDFERKEKRAWENQEEYNNISQGYYT